MKRILLIFLLVVIGIFLYAQNYTNVFYYSRCEEPIKYRIGEIDPQFNITKEKLRTTTEEATKIWNEEWGMDLLVYDATAELSVNLVYDERQELTSKITSTKNVLEKDNRTIEVQIREYEAELQRLEQRVAELNTEIAYWNNNGGAPEDVYSELIREQNSLSDEIRIINKRAQELNNTTMEYNSEVENLNDKVSDFNSLLDAKPEEGLYIPTENRIEVYIVNNDETLKHTIAHEFGHAIGIEHVEDPESLMYATVSNAVKLSDKDKEGLAEACRVRNRLEETFTRFKTLYSQQT